MKRNPKKRITSLQETRLKRIAGFLLAGTLLWFLLAPHRGVLALLDKRTELKALQEKSTQIEAENTRLREQIDRLKKDPAYLEDLARREYGLLKEREFIYDFSKPEKKEE
jgi:cell division protein FtsB